jgi:hypothetical protein
MSGRSRGFAGRGPRAYARSDDRIFEEVCEVLTRDADLDARLLRVTVRDRRVTLDGRVESRPARHLAEDLAASVRGVVEVDNRLRVGEGGSLFDPELRGDLFGTLIQEHRMTAALLDIVLTTPAESPRERVVAFRDAAREILAHLRAEQEVVYAALAGSYELADEIEEAQDAHARIEALIRQIDELGDGGPRWLGRVQALQRTLDAHVRHEEAVVLPGARTVIDPWDHQEDLLATYLRDREMRTRELDERAAPLRTPPEEERDAQRAR